MEKLIRQVFTEWKSVKKRAQKDCENRALFDLAEQYRACCMFKGTENIEQIIKLFFSLPGVEFCQKNNFPDVETLRQFKQYDVARFGVFIDAGRVSLTDTEKVILIGNTDATIICDKTLRYDVILMHGAKADVRALNWAMVHVVNKNGCDVKLLLKDRARIL